MTKLLLDTKIGFIGAGVMATAICDGLVRSGVLNHRHIVVSDPALKDKESHKGYRIAADNEEIIKSCDIVFLCVKPKIFKSIVPAFGVLRSDPQKGRTLIISVMAGMTIEDIDSAIYNAIGVFPADRQLYRVARVMPNLGVQINVGVCAYCVDDNAPEEDILLVQSILSSLGHVERVKEDDMTAVTAISGAGPAYVYTMIEAIADGGVKAGLAREVALRLAANTVLGSGKMLIETQTHPAILRDQTCSPGGVTMKGVAALEQNNFRHAVMSAVEAALNR